MFSVPLMQSGYVSLASEGVSPLPPATLLASFVITDETNIANFSRIGSAGFTGDGDAYSFQREATDNVLRTSHFIGAYVCVILEDDPTPCVLVAPGTPSVTPDSLKFSATFSAIPVTVSLLRYEYRLDGIGSWTSNSTSTTLTDVAASEGDHVVNVRAISTSGVAGEIVTSASFTVTAPAITGDPAIVSVDSFGGFNTTLDGAGIRFTPSVGITITALGFWKNSSITGTKTLHVYAADGTTELASADVPLTGAPDDDWVIAPLASPLDLTAFTTAILLADLVNGVDGNYLSCAITSDLIISVNNSVFRSGATFSNYEGADHNGGPVQFYFEITP